jgi:hypothetical protein
MSRCACGEDNPSPIVLMQRCVAPRRRQASISASHAARGTCASVRRPSSPKRAGSRPAATTHSRSSSTMAWSSAVGRHCGIQPSARRAARRRAASDIPPSQIGIGRWTGNGLRPTAGSRCQRPSKLTTRLCPEQPQHGDLLFLPPAARVKVHAERDVLRLVPADSHAEPQAPAREHIHLRRLLGDQHGLPLRQDDDASDQLETPRHCREIPEQDERLVELVPRMVRTAPPGVVSEIHADDMLVGQQMRVPELLDSFGIRTDHGRIAADFGLRENHADPHDQPLSDRARTRARTSTARLYRNERFPSAESAGGTGTRQNGTRCDQGCITPPCPLPQRARRAAYLPPATAPRADRTGQADRAANRTVGERSRRERTHRGRIDRGDPTPAMRNRRDGHACRPSQTGGSGTA